MAFEERLHPRAGDGKFTRGGKIKVVSRGAAGDAVAEALPHPGSADATPTVRTRNLTQADFKEHGGDTTEIVGERAGHAIAARWDVPRSDLDALAAEEGIPLAGKTDAQAREAVARHIVRSWSGSSGQPTHIVAINAVADDLGVPPHGDDRTQRVLAWVHERPPIDNALRSFGRAMYAETQHWLAERGVDKLTVRRAGFANDRERPWTSWTLHHGGMRHEPGRVDRTADIPARYVMSVPPTGFGTLAESEVVVLPGW